MFLVGLITFYLIGPVSVFLINIYRGYFNVVLLLKPLISNFSNIKNKWSLSSYLSFFYGQFNMIIELV